MKRYRWGSTVVQREDSIAARSLFTHDENTRITQALEDEQRRLESYQAGARAGNPVSAVILQEKLRLVIYKPQQTIGPFPSRCLKCGGRLIEGKCEGRWIEENVEGRRRWIKCQAVWTNGGKHASAATS